MVNTEKLRDDVSIKKKNFSSDDVHEMRYSIRDLPASNVTIYPTQSSVERQIDSVQIRSGRNEITITDLTLFADEHSIKVEGRGDAIITDTTVDTIFNTYVPEDDDSDTQESPESDSDQSSSDNEDMKALDEEIDDLKSQVADLTERETSASTQLSTLEGYGKSMSADSFDVKLVSNYLEMYQTERLRLYKEHKESRSEKTKLNTLLEKKVKEKNKKINVEKSLKFKENARKARLAQAKKAEKEAKLRKKQAEEYKRPRQAYSVLIVIEGSQDETVSLKMTYLVKQASWTPRYDLILDSTSKTAQIIYKAHFLNYTFEDWQDAHIRLSTSVTTFAGLSDTVPLLTPWNVKLGKRNAWQTDSLHSLQEQEITKRKKLGSAPPGVAPQQMMQQVQLQAQQQQRAQMMQQQFAQQQVASSSLFGNAQNATNSNPGGLFGSVASNVQASGFGSTQPQNDLMGFNNVQQPTPRGERRALGASFQTDRDADSSDEEDEAHTETSTLNPVARDMLHSESHRNSHGMTTTYDMPGLRTIKSSSLTRRFIICKIDVSDVVFSSVVVPKLRSAAFTKARIRNTSNTTLLRGTAGLTLDGSYLGTTVIPTCHSEDTFSLSLGVDTAVTVSYSKPSQKTSSKGYINKEETTLYSRSIFLHNAKPTEITLLVFDQIPVSEDEKLKINIISPKGLRQEGDNVKTGVVGNISSGAGSGDSEKNVPSAASIARKSVVLEKWGQANATLKKDGQVAWLVKLEKGKNCRLALEYEVKYPDGDAMFAVPS